jgi:hypothetical protein
MCLFTLSARNQNPMLLLRLVMDGVFSAKRAVLLHLETVRVVLLVLDSVVVSVLALAASQSDFHAHGSAPPYSSDSLSDASLYHSGESKIF